MTNTKAWQKQLKEGGDWQALMRKTCWHPNVVLENCVELLNADDNGFPEHWFSIDERTNLVSFKCRVRGVFLEKYELADFPFDSQPLTLRMHSTWDASRVTFIPIQDALATLSTDSPLAGPGTLGADFLDLRSFTLEEWRLQRLLFTRAARQDGARSASGSTYSTLHVECELHRRSLYYLWNVFAIVCTICSLGFIVVFTPPDHFADRCSITLTLLLTAVAYKYIVSEKLPAISYLTLADNFVLSSFGLLCGIVLENVVAASVMWAQADAAVAWPAEAQREAALLVDRIGLGALAGVWLLYNLGFYWKAHAAKHTSGRRSLTPHRAWRHLDPNTSSFSPPDGEDRLAAARAGSAADAENVEPIARPVKSEDQVKPFTGSAEAEADRRSDVSGAAHEPRQLQRAEESKRLCWVAFDERRQPCGTRVWEQIHNQPKLPDPGNAGELAETLDDLLASGEGTGRHARRSGGLGRSLRQGGIQPLLHIRNRRGKVGVA